MFHARWQIQLVPKVCVWGYTIYRWWTKSGYPFQSADEWRCSDLPSLLQDFCSSQEPLWCWYSLPVWCSLSSFEKRNDQNHVWRDGDGTYCKWYFQRCRTIDRTNPNLNVHRSGPVSPVILGLLSRHQSWIENQTLTTGGGGILVFLGPTSHLVMCFGWWQCIYNWNKPTTWRLESPWSVISTWCEMAKLA